VIKIIYNLFVYRKSKILCQMLQEFLAGKHNKVLFKKIYCLKVEYQVPIQQN
jgi:hypothetical protein